MGARQCLFCLNPANSKEHLWPDWILQSLKHRTPIRQNIGKSPTKVFNGPLTVRCVCRTCNGGWMSQLESDAKTTIGPLMHDLSFSLDAPQQETVSAWAVKTAMVVEATNRRTRACCYTQQECEHLRLQRSIPIRTLAWLGRFSASGLLATGTDIWLDIDGVKKAAHGCVTTIIVGHLALQVLTAHLPPKYNSTTVPIVCVNGPWNDVLIPLFPTSNRITWPPKLSFTNGGKISFTFLRDRWKYGTAV